MKKIMKQATITVAMAHDTACIFTSQGIVISYLYAVIFTSQGILISYLYTIIFTSQGLLHNRVEPIEVYIYLD